MQAPSAPSLRLRLLEPSLSWTTRPSTSNTVDISGRFVLDTQLECVLPSFERQAARAIAARTCLAASSASVSSAPQLVPLSVEVILNGGEQRSNTLSFKLHQPLEVRRICPQSVLLVSPAVTATVTLNILKLSVPVAHKTTPKGGQLEVLEDISTLPVFIRVKQASERTGAVSEQTREGKWKLSPLGVYEVGFDAPTMGFGAASVEITLNRTEFFRCKSDAPPEGFGYRVRRDVTLRAVEPACISVTSGQVTEVKLVGDGFVDSGDIVVAMLQKELSSTEADAAKPAKEVQVAQLNATYYGKNEVRCTVPANLPFGCTSFSVSLNGGRQFGQSRVVGLLHRDRALEGISPASSSLAGGTTVRIRYSCLSLEDADAFYQLQRLDPPRRIHVRFQPASYSGTDGGGLAKVVNAEASSQTPGVLIFVRSAIPLSADILGGSCIRLQGENLVDHGAQMSVIFESSSMSRKVSAFVEKGELRCCAPPFNVGRARVFVSLNDDQYTLCDLHDPETNAPLEFIFYSSPTVTRISPVCACVRQPSELKIYGTNLIETDRIKVRFSFPASAGRRLIFKDVPGTARDGVITVTTPVFPDEYANQNALVDVALNGANLSGTSVPLRYFSKYGITRVDPPLGAFEVPVTLTVFLAPVIVTDKILVRLRLGVIKMVTEHESSKEELEIIYGPVEASTWTASSVEFMVLSLSTLVESLPVLTTAHLEVSFDGVHFHGVGNLRDHYRVYNMPQLTSANPLFGLSDRETRVVAHGVHMRPGDVVKLTLFLESTSADKSKVKDRRRAAPVPVTTVIAEVNVKRQRLSFTCPSLVQLRASPDRQYAPLVAASPVISGGMLLPERVIMQISVIDGQPISLPFVFRYYRAPTLVVMNPHAGYVCSGSIVSFEFAERIATPTVDFRFGDSLPSSGRIREERFVECFSPELSAGTHCISISFNEQHYEPAVLMERQVEQLKDSEHSVATFHAFPLPVFVLPPAGRDRVYAFGPTSGGTVVVIKGKGFVPDTKIYVRFASQFKDAFDGQSEIIVSAKVMDGETIRCISPPSMRLGRAVLHVSYNLQQFSDSTCFFEYHAPTRYVAKGTLCGPISGQTPMKLIVEDMKGLPSLTQLLQCVVRFESEKHGVSSDVEAQFDPESCILSCITPAWPINELVGLRVSLSRGEGELFEDTQIKFLFYDPPEGVIKIEPAAGPIGGGTEVLAWCGSIVETGEITVSIQLSRNEPMRPSLMKRRSSTTLSLPLSRKSSLQVLPSILVRGEIVGESVRFVTPPVDGPCTAVLGISLNGINYTSTQSPLHFTYYVEPILRRINPGWAALEGAYEALVIEGEHIRDFGCKLLVRFSLQDEKQPEHNDIVVGAQFISNSTASATGDGALQCVFPAAPPGFYELEISLNGQQFSQSQYVSKTFGNLSGTACTALLPFRHFASPFCLATPTGPAAGGSTVVLFLGGKLLKILSRETKCQVQFAPIRGTERVTRLPPANPNIGTSPIKVSSNVAEIMCMVGDIDHTNARVTCRAPLLRVACVSNVDILLPSGSGASSACQLFGIRFSEREKYYSYESPSITEIAPSCGPVSGGTQLVIEGAHILDTAQIFVRFRSNFNEREFVLVPARYSRTFPGGSASASPLIICNTPPVEFVDKTISTGIDSAAQSSTVLPPHTQPSPRVRDGAAAGKARTQTYQMLAEQSLKAQRASVSHDNGLSTLRITRPSIKATPRGHSEAESGATVLVDFTLNAGEQFIAHSVRFHYYQDIDPRQVKWSPRHLPTQCLASSPESANLTTPRSDSIGTPVSSRRQAIGAHGMKSRPITPDLSSPRPATTGSPPCIAGKVIGANEVTCVVPDFATQELSRFSSLQTHSSFARRRDDGRQKARSNPGSRAEEVQFCVGRSSSENTADIPELKGNDQTEEDANVAAEIIGEIDENNADKLKSGMKMMKPLHVAVIGPCAAQFNVVIIDGRGKEVTPSAITHSEPEVHENCRSFLTAVDPTVIVDSTCDVCYVCVRFGAVDDETLSTCSDQDVANIQVLVLDNNGVQLCLCGFPVESTLWIPLGIVPQASNAGPTSSQKKEDKFLSSVVGGTTGGGSIVALVSSWSTFTFTIRIECGDQRQFASCRENSVFAAISSGSVLSWEEEFELRIAADRRAPLLLTAELSEPSLPKPLELAQAWVPLNGIQVGSSDIRRYTARFEEHFKRGNYVGSEGTPGTATEVELLLQLSPLMLHPDYIVCKFPYQLLQQLSPQALDVQVSSGDGFYSVPHSFVVYKPPTVTQTTPTVLPRSAGGDVIVTGTGFVNSGRVCVRLLAFKKNRFINSSEEQRALASINRVKRFQRTESTNDGFFPYFSRDVEGVFISTTSLKFRMPSYLTSYNVYYSVSFDGRSFTEASNVSNVLMFSINAVTPKGGPISGNTYATLHGTNIDACLSLRSGLTPLIRVTWKRGARDLEHVMVPGEFYPHEDAVYFYSPQSKFGLYSVAVSVELALISSGVTGVDTIPRFGRDEVSFVMYKTPTIKSVAPLTALVSGVSTTEIIVQGFEEKAVSNMRLAPKLRFKRRGQMQVSDAQLVSESRFECVVPRFNVTNAVATELPLSVLSSVPPVHRLRAGGALSPRRLHSQPKLWTRTAGIFVALLGARNLRASKKNACNPFAVVYVGKAQLKSTRKDGVFSPVWNELFDFEWTSNSDSNLPQSSSTFRAPCVVPLRRIRGKYYRKENEEAAVQVQKNSKKQAISTLNLGEVELAIAFIPPVAQIKKHKKALRSSIISVITTQPQSRKQSQGKGGSGIYSSKKEKLLRAFRQRGAPISLVPTELAVELALNGQDFCSYVNVYVSLNGSDFDSIALPKQLLKLSEPAAERPQSSVNFDERIEESDETVVEESPRKSPRKTTESDSAISLESEQYVIDCKKVISLALDGGVSGRHSPTRLLSSSRNENFLLVPQLRVYLTPKITRVRPTDGIYTSHLTIDGTNFTNTGVATARFTSQTADSEVRTAKLVVVSSTRMECSVPDFPRGVMVRISVALNGIEFVPCPGELRVFQSPRLTELYPNWVSANTTLELELRGINLTAVMTASMDDNSRGQQNTTSIQVSFSNTRERKVIRGKCEDGKFTGSPLPLHVYREIPTVHLVSPMDGPVYGGFAIVVEGHGFVDTGKIVVRFQLYSDQQEATPRTEGESSRPLQSPGLSPTKSVNTLDKRQGKERIAIEKVSVEAPTTVTEPVLSYVDVVAKFVSAERVLCPAPAFPQEGVYTVLVALNSVEFSRVSDGSWFLAWQNWQKRKRLLSHALFSRASAPDEAASAAAIAGAAAASASLDEDDVEKLRRKSSFMLPKIRSALAATPEDSSSTSFRAKNNESVSYRLGSDDTEEMLMKDPQLLQWRPISWMEAKVSGRPLLSLLEYLCGVRETQQSICRRLRVAFRLKSTQSRGGNDSTEVIPALRFNLFVKAVRMIFPNALMRDLEELWHAAEHRPDGTMTIKQLLRRLQRYAASDHRSKSPEPGPTHYEPRYNIVSSRETAAIILPPVAQPESISDPPSTLFIDYDAAVQAVKPRAPRPVFRKRKFNTSWCNPVVEGAKEATPSPRPPSKLTEFVRVHAHELATTWQ
ncbi:Immunoglobulin E-set [Phytophthora cactorum]|nr:Immunoglobulin E-set [Phytophthora cactorum]